MFNAKYEKSIFGCEGPTKISEWLYKKFFQKDVKFAQRFNIIMHDIVFITLKAHINIWSGVKCCLVIWIGTELWHLADLRWKTDLEVSQVEKPIESYPFVLLTCLKPPTHFVFEIFQEGYFIWNCRSRQSCKFFASCVNSLRKQSLFLHFLRSVKKFTHLFCKFTPG